MKAGKDAFFWALHLTFEGTVHPRERKSAEILEPAVLPKNLENRSKGVVCQDQCTKDPDLHS